MSSRGDQDERGQLERSSLRSAPASVFRSPGGLPRAGRAAVTCWNVLSHISAQNIEGLSHGQSHQRLEKVVPVRSKLPNTG